MRLAELKKLVLGDTWSLPLGIAAVLIGAALLRYELLSGECSREVIGPLLFVGLGVVLWLSTRRG